MSLADIVEAQSGQHLGMPTSPTTHESLCADLITIPAANWRDPTPLYEDSEPIVIKPDEPTETGQPVTNECVGQNETTANRKGGVSISPSGSASAAGDTVSYLNLSPSSPATLSAPDHQTRDLQSTTKFANSFARGV